MSGWKRISLVVAIFVSMAVGAGAGVVDKPVVLPGTMVSIAVPDLHGFIDGVGEISEQVSPMLNSMMLNNMIGMQVGDPGLAGIAPGKGLAVVVLDQTNYFAVIEVGEAQSPAYAAALSQKGMQSKYADGVLVFATDAVQLAKGEALLPAVEETLLAQRTPTLRIAVQPAALCENNQEQIEGMMVLMPMMMGMSMQQTPGMDPAAMEQPLKILEGEIRFFLSCARQSESMEIVVAPQNGSLRISETLEPKADTRLAAMVNAPKVNSPNPKIQAGLLGKGAIAVDCTMANPDAVTTFFVEEINEVLKTMGVETEDLAKMGENMKKWMELYKGSFCENIGFGGDSFMNVSYVLEVKDETQPLAMFKSMNEDMAPFLKLYESMGMPISFEFKENVREYKGVNIHQFKMDITMSEEQQAALQSMKLNNMVYDIAICDGLLLYAMGDPKVETLIDRVKDTDYKVVPLKARSVYPANASYYCDIDIAAYMSGISSVMPSDPNNPMPQIAAMLQGAEPITAAGFCEDGMLSGSINIPGSLLAKVGQAATTLQMQKMQQQQMQQGNPGMAPMNTGSTEPVGDAGEMPEEEAPARTPAD